MKKFILLYLLSCSSLIASAQKYQIFGDIGISTLLFRSTDFSVTADRMFGRHFGIGLGAQTLTASAYAPSQVDNNPSVLKTSIFADTRCDLYIHKSLIFLFADLGISLYHAPAIPGVQDAHSNGFYIGLGIGYSYPVNARGMGPYISFKMASDVYTFTEYDRQTYQPHKTSILDGIGIVALGFKF
ncbi:MAG: hypothetical protein JSS96_14460 [Bacteroidetes bacterium]|nr:hypothetical protein [Bacteroidota bacterium]